MSVPARVLDLFFPRRKGLARAVPRGRLFLILGAALCLALIGVWAAPRLLSLAYLTRGSRMLERAVQAAGLPVPPAFACDVGPITGQAEQTMLRQAIQNLKTTLRYDPWNSNASLLLGRAYCLSGQAQRAVDFYRTFTQRRPVNPLGHMELALAYSALCLSRDTGQKIGVAPEGCADSSLRGEIQEEWQQAGIYPDQLVAMAQEYFTKHNYAAASRWYQHAALSGAQIPPVHEFQWIIALVFTGHDLPEAMISTVVKSYSLQEKLEIEAKNMQWISEQVAGQPLSVFLSGNSKAGTMWWNGAAIAALRVAQPGEYQVTIRAQNTPPAPVQLQLELNDRAIGSLELVKEDNSWQEFHFDLKLDAGLQIIGIRFLNNGIVNGKDRNAVFERITVEKK